MSKPTRSNALVPAGPGKPPTRKKSAVPAVVTATNETLLPMLDRRTQSRS